MKYKAGLPILIVVSAVLFATCSSVNQTSGNGSEITNGVAVSADGPATNAVVTAYPANYVPMSNDSSLFKKAISDKNGKFEIVLGSSAWNLLIYDAVTKHGAFISLGNGDSTLGRIVLDTLGEMKCVLPLDSNGQPVVNANYAGILGSPFFSKLSIDTSVIQNVPSYSYNISTWRPSKSCSGDSCPPPWLYDTTFENVTIEPGQTVSIDVKY